MSFILSINQLYEMSNLIADRNTLEMLQGVNGYNDWNFWAFEKPLTQLDSECEDTWLERLLHTAMAIEEQIEFTEAQSYADIQIQKGEVIRLSDRLRDFREVIGFIPTNKGIENPDYLKLQVDLSEQKKNRVKVYPQVAKINQENKFRQYLRNRLSGTKKVTIQTIWSELRNCEGQVIEGFIEVKSVSGNSNCSVIEWVDDETGIQGASLKRDSVKKAMSVIRRDIKAKK